MLFSVRMSLCQMSQSFALPSLLCFAICTSLANAACIDVKQTKSFSFEGLLSYTIFPGQPNYEDPKGRCSRTYICAEIGCPDLRHRR